MFCTNCGSALDEDSLFCGVCGTPVASANKSKPAKKKKKPFLALIIVVAVVLVLVIPAVLILPLLSSGGTQTIYVKVEEVRYSSDGTEIRRIENEYDECGRLLSSETDNGEASEIWDDELKMYIYEIGECDGRTDLSSEYEYDEYGNVIEYQYEYDGRSSSGISYEYDYDENGLMEGYEYSYMLSDFAKESGMSIQPSVFEFEYDSDGNLIEVTEDTDMGDKIVQSYEYDDEGRLVAETFYEYDATYRTEFAYEDGVLVCYDRYIGGIGYLVEDDRLVRNDVEYTRSETVEFDYEDGLLVSKTVCDSSRNIMEYSYNEKGFLTDMTGAEEIELDEAGNIVAVEYEDGTRVEYEYEALEVSDRDAEYFRRREGILNDAAHLYDDIIYYYLIPNPIW